MLQRNTQSKTWVTVNTMSWKDSFTIVFLMKSFPHTCQLGMFCLPAGCGANFSAPSGRVVSPNYPADYPDNSNCNYTIDAGEQTVIVLTFRVFQLEGKRRCGQRKMNIGFDQFSTRNSWILCSRWMFSKRCVSNSTLHLFVWWTEDLQPSCEQCGCCYSMWLEHTGSHLHLWSHACPFLLWLYFNWHWLHGRIYSHP